MIVDESSDNRDPENLQVPQFRERPGVSESESEVRPKIGRTRLQAVYDEVV